MKVKYVFSASHQKKSVFVFFTSPAGLNRMTSAQPICMSLRQNNRFIYGENVLTSETLFGSAK